MTVNEIGCRMDQAQSESCKMLEVVVNNDDGWISKDSTRAWEVYTGDQRVNTMVWEWLHWWPKEKVEDDVVVKHMASWRILHRLNPKRISDGSICVTWGS